MQFPLLDVTCILHNKNPLLNKLSPTQSSMGIPFRMVMLHEMIICELCCGEKQGAGRSSFSGGGDRSGLRDETGDRPLSQEFSRDLGGISKVILLTLQQPQRVWSLTCWSSPAGKSNDEISSSPEGQHCPVALCLLCTGVGSVLLIV